MDAIVGVYCLNGMFLVLHEIESAFEREWEILGLPGRISGFLAFHVPLLLLLFYGLAELARGSRTGLWLAAAFAAGGALPFVVHEILARRRGRFDRVSSRLLIYGNLASAAALIALSWPALARG